MPWRTAVPGKPYYLRIEAAALVFGTYPNLVDILQRIDEHPGVSYISIEVIDA
jgi:hypothetical protein